MSYVCNCNNGIKEKQVADHIHDKPVIPVAKKEWNKIVKGICGYPMQCGQCVKEGMEIIRAHNESLERPRDASP